MIQTIVELGCGKYSHEDVFELEVGFIYQLRLMEYEHKSYQQRHNYYHKEFNDTTKR